MTPIRIHDFTLSGHAHRVRLFCSLLGLPVELHLVDLRGGEHKSPAFLAMTGYSCGEVLGRNWWVQLCIYVTDPA